MIDTDFRSWLTGINSFTMDHKNTKAKEQLNQVLKDLPKVVIDKP
jgi:hypothetical protein